MSESEALTPAHVETPPLTQSQRVVYTFTAPSKTFTDILRNRSWWLPFVLSIVFGYVFIFAMQSKIGWEKLTESALKQNPRVAAMTPEQRAPVERQTMMSVKGFSYGLPVMALAITAITALVLWGTINFAFGGKATYGEVFAVWMYASLVLIIKSLLGAIALFAGLDAESFNIQNPVGTNIGYYMPTELPKWLLVLGSWFDVITIWELVLAGIGLAIVAKVKRSSGLIAVFGWWVLIMLISVGFAAATG